MREPRFAELADEIAREELQHRTSKYSEEVRCLAKAVLRRVDQFREDHPDLKLTQRFDASFNGYRLDSCLAGVY